MRVVAIRSERQEREHHVVIHLEAAVEVGAELLHIRKGPRLIPYLDVVSTTIDDIHDSEQDMLAGFKRALVALGATAIDNMQLSSASNLCITVEEGRHEGSFHQ